MARDPALGPMTRAEMAEAISAPAGKAAEMIRKYDPFWGKAIDAIDQEEADKLAEKLKHDDFDDSELTITAVEPAQATE